MSWICSTLTEFRLKERCNTTPRVKQHRSQQRKLNVSVDCCSSLAALVPLLGLLNLFAIRTNSLSFVSSVRKSARTLIQFSSIPQNNKKEIEIIYLFFISKGEIRTLDLTDLFFISKGEIRTLDLTGMSRALSPTELPCHNSFIFIKFSPAQLAQALLSQI